MEQLFSKLLDVVASDKHDYLKLPSIIFILGMLVVFLSGKLPETVEDRGVIELVGIIIACLGFVLLFFNYINRLVGVDLITCLSDGIISGLFATLLVSLLTFAYTEYTTEQDSYFYRLMIASSYGMMYGGAIGTLSAFFSKNAKIDLKRYISLMMSLYVLFCYAISKYIFPKIPVVDADPLKNINIFLMHVVFIYFFMALNTKRLLPFEKPAMIFYLVTTFFSVIFLVILKQKFFFPDDYPNGDENLANMTFYVDYTPSLYMFCAVMIYYSTYVLLNIFFSFFSLKELN